jgi:predicted NBD/HSP70 family sugar kinase
VSLCFDPDVIVLGGDLTDYFDQLLEPLQARLRPLLPTEPKMVVSTLGHRAAVLGAITNVLHQTADFYMLRSMA